MVGLATTRHEKTHEPTREPAGTRQLFEQLVGPHHDMAVHLAMRMMGNLDDAEDAVQEALLKAYRHLETFRQVQRPRAWLLRVVFNQCLDARRRRDVRRRHEERIEGKLAPAADVGSAQRDSLRRVREVLAELPAKQQAVLHLRVFEQSSYEEIGAVLGLTPRSARVYLVKARAHMRARLGREMEDR
jgi:RNA polymerase sigma-70 factor (ECF subfamily)